MNAFKKLPERSQGVICLLFGVAMILLYMFGIIQKSVALVVMVLAVIAIIYGLKQLGVVRMLESMFRRK